MLYYADCLMRKESIFPENISEYFPLKRSFRNHEKCSLLMLKKT